MNARRRTALALAPFELLAMGALGIEAAARWAVNAGRDAIDVGGKWARVTGDDE